MSRKTLVTALALGLVVGLTACDSNEGTLSNEDINVAERIGVQPELEGFQGALESAGLLSTLRGNSPYTVFATTLQDVDTGSDAFTEDVLTDVLNYHIVEGEVTSSDLSDGQTLQTLSGDELDVTVQDGSPLINGAPIVEADLPASNGTVHIVGRTLLENQSLATRATVTNQTSFLSTAVGEAGIDLSQDGITVFGPTNGALTEFVLGSGGPNDLLGFTGLGELLNYHVVPQELTASDLVSNGSQSYTTVQGEEIDVTVSNGTVLVNDAVVSTADLEGTNGVLHLIGPQPSRGVEGVLTEDIFDTQQRLQYTASTQALFTAAAEAGADLSEGTGDQPYTVFAPRNAAFSDVNLENVVADPDLAAKIVNYHVVPGQEVTASDFSSGDNDFTTAEGSDLTVTVTGGGVKIPDVDSIPVSVTDVNTTNGVVHYVDAAPLQSHLTITERALAYAPLATLAEAAVETGRAQTLDGSGPFTTFAPTESAFGALPGDVLTSLLEEENDLLGKILDYHVLESETDTSDIAQQMANGDSTATTALGQDVMFGRTGGGGITVNGVALDSADVGTSNGFVHTIGGAPLVPLVNAVETGVLNGFLSFRTATEVTDLRGTISGEEVGAPDPITVFVPSDAAFDAYLESIGAPSLTRLNQDEEDALAETLQYHAVDQELTAEDIVSRIENSMDGSYSVQTLEGSELTFTLREDGAILVNGEPIAAADLEATNGVIHSIGSVLSVPQSGS